MDLSRLRQMVRGLGSGSLLVDLRKHLTASDLTRGVIAAAWGVSCSTTDVGSGDVAGGCASAEAARARVAKGRRMRFMEGAYRGWNAVGEQARGRKCGIWARCRVYTCWNDILK